MKTFNVFLCILVCCVAAARAAGGESAVQSVQSTSFKDWLARGQARPSSRHYNELDKATVCFRQASFCHMKCDATDKNKCATYTMNEIANLACTTCPEDLTPDSYYDKHPYGHKDFKSTTGYDVAANPTSLPGKCYMNKVRLYGDDEVPLAGLDGVVMAGTFTGVCYLNDDTKCGLPEGCDDIEVTMTGVVYKVDNAVRVGPAYGGAPGDIPNECRKNNPNPIREPEPASSGAGRAADASKPGAKAPDSTAKIQLRPDDEEKLVVGKATIYWAPFTVHSDAHAVKYNRGYFQFSFFSDEGEQDAASVSDDWPRLGDETYKLEFISDAKPHY